jgi:hypothetical protein
VSLQRSFVRRSASITICTSPRTRQILAVVSNAQAASTLSTNPLQASQTKHLAMIWQRIKGRQIQGWQCFGHLEPGWIR